MLMNHAFARQDSRQTLAEGIVEYRQSLGSTRPRIGSTEALEFFRCHDAAHVIFGCGNSLNEEAIVKISSILGTSGGFAVLTGYLLHESLQIYRKLQAGDVLVSLIQSAYLMPRTMFRCARQHHRWPWSDFAAFLPVPLVEIRNRFGIRVAHSSR
jgi:hypothetical protein